MSRRGAVWLVALLGLVLTLSACGFRPRGAPQYEHLSALQLRGASLNLEHLVRRALETSGVAVHDAAPLALTISDENTQRRTVAVDRYGRAAEMELRYSFTWQLLDADSRQPLNERRNIALIRNFIYDADNATAASDEESSTRDSLYEDATWQLLRQLDATVGRLRAAQPDNWSLDGETRADRHAN
ncbi:LPS-assembly lipoprotein LptE [Isoalcanivorax beigongshangi]|uniref:LPS-assembly lipoprotein LptE n=1 Tax=Isoalcanivorax beigongshangi TaxID=3238810 RepID=A0ABV4AF90_9GAMM